MNVFFFIIKYNIIYYLLFMIFSCNTFKQEENKSKISSPSSSTSIYEKVQEIQQEHKISKNEIAYLKNENQSLKEEIYSIKRNMEIIRKGLRSGIFEDNLFEENNKTLDITKPTFESKSNIDTSFGQEKIINKKEEHNNQLEFNSPEKLLSDAEIKMQRAQYGEAIIILTKIEKNYASFNDEGKTQLFLAECWNKLNQFDNAVIALKTFLLQNQFSTDMQKAKFLLAEAYEGSEQKEKAILTYKEVISLAPTSAYAQKARTALTKIKDNY